MKYKEQAITKIEKLESQIKLLEMSVNRSFSLERIHTIIDSIKDIVENLKDNINAEHDDWNSSTF